METPALNAHTLRRAVRGFTLIEVMITVAIIGILAALAYPAYVDNIKRGKAGEAMAQLTMARVRAEAWSGNNNGLYTGFPCPPSTENFDYACAINPNDYSIVANGKASEDMGDFVFTINNADQRTSMYNGVSAACWQTNKSGTC